MTELDPFTIVCVCTGNVCRSPAAERLLAVALGPTVIVSSAGTGALVGEPVSPPMDDLIRSVGGDPDDFAARQVSERLLREADLVLALSRDHRRAVVELAPATVRRTFTLREYARLLSQLTPDELPDDSPAARARASVPAVNAHRRMASPEEDDIADPFQRGEAAYRAAFEATARAVDQIEQVLRPRDLTRR